MWKACALLRLPSCLSDHHPRRPRDHAESSCIFAAHLAPKRNGMRHCMMQRTHLAQSGRTRFSSGRCLVQGTNMFCFALSRPTEACRRTIADSGHCFHRNRSRVAMKACDCAFHFLSGETDACQNACLCKRALSICCACAAVTSTLSLIHDYLRPSSLLGGRRQFFASLDCFATHCLFNKGWRLPKAAGTSQSLWLTKLEIRGSWSHWKRCPDHDGTTDSGWASQQRPGYSLKGCGFTKGSVLDGGYRL